MKNKRRILTKKELLLYFGMRSPKKKPNPLRFLLYPFLALAFSPYFFMLYFLFINGFSANQMMLGVDIVPLLTMGLFMVIHLILLVNGLPALFARFYGNKDNAIVFPMPVSGADIMLSRSIPIFIMQAFLALVLFAAFMVALIQTQGANIHQWIHLLIGLVTSIIFPTAIAAVLLILLMRFTNVGRYSNALKVVGFILLMAFIFGIQFFIQRSAGNEASPDASVILETLVNQRALIEGAATLFIPSRWTALAYLDGGIGGYIYSGLNVLLSILSIGLLTLVSQKYYLKAMLAGQEVAKHKAKKNQKVREGKVRPAYFAIFQTEWRNIMRTPAYMINILSTPIILPIIWLMPIFAAPEVLEQARSLGPELQSVAIPIFYVGGGILVGFFLGNLISMFSSLSTSVSREGEAFKMRRVLPLKARDEIIGRSMVHWVITIASAIILSGILLYIFQLPLWVVPVIAIASVYFSTPLGFIGLLVDYSRPKLHWSDANEAVKQNFNSFLAFLFNLVNAIIFAIVGFVLYQMFGMSAQFFGYGMVALIVLNAIITGILYFVLKGTIEEKLQSLEM